VELRTLKRKISKRLKHIGRTTMPKRTGDFNAWHLEKLSDPTIAANYLNKVWKDSRELFLDAVKDVIQARHVSTVAKEAGIQRESVYRSFSSSGNPTWTTMQAVLCAVGVEFPGVRPIKAQASQPEPFAPKSAGTRKRRGRRKTRGPHSRQLLLPLSDDPIAAAAVSSGARITPIEQSNKGISRIPTAELEVLVQPGFFLQQQQGGATPLPNYAF
jgi:probable addiction module antidote protein